MTNYVVKKGDYKPLSDIMGSDYETTDTYIVHINKTGSSLQVLTLTSAETPTNDERGVEYKEYEEFEVKADSGDDVYFRSTFGNISVDIRVKSV